MPPSLDDSSFIVVGDTFDNDEDEDNIIDDLLSLKSQREENVDGTLIVPSSSTTFTPPSSVDSDITSLDLNNIHIKQRMLVPDDDDDDMEGIDDPLDLPCPNVDATDVVPPSKFFQAEPSTMPWTLGINQARTILQEKILPAAMVTTSRRNLVLFLYLPFLMAVLGVAAYTKQMDTIRLRDIEMANKIREKEHEQRIKQLQEEIEKLKKQQSSFTFNIPEPSWLKMDYTESKTTQSLIKQWNDIKTSAHKTVDSLRTTLEKDLEEAKEWWNEKQQVVVEMLHQEDTSRFQGKEHTSDEDETEADTVEAHDKGSNLMPSKKTILASAAVVTMASVLMGVVMDYIFGQASPSRLDYDTLEPFGVPLADFVE